MDRRLFWWFCLLTALRSAESQDGKEPAKLEFTIKEKKLHCNDNGNVIGKIFPESRPLTEDQHETYTCKKDEHDECTLSQDCPKITVKVLSGDSLIQLDVQALVTVLLSDVIVTGMIGWAVYSVCAQPRVRSGYQGNKASDRVNLIPNHSAGDTYQPLNTRSDEYSTLHGARKPKNPKHPI